MSTEKTVFTIHIEGTQEEVWQEITKTDTLQQAMFNARLHTSELKPGNKMAMRTESGKYTMVFGEVLEYDPPHRFAHSFRFTLYDDPPCKVIYELVPSKGGVDFTLRLEDLPAGSKTAKDMIAGGDFIVKTLKRVIESGKLPLATRLQYFFYKILEGFLPKKAKSEHWPL